MKDKDYIAQLISQGEHEHQDFKYQISDARKIARSISAFANNGGGHLLVGVKDNGAIAGVRSDEEIYMIEQAASMYCQPEQSVRFTVYHIEGKAVVKADIAEAASKPVKAPDENGKFKAYYRAADENVLASGMHVKMMHRHNEPETATVLSYSKHEEQLIAYLNTHGAISIAGYMRLAHLSHQAAEQSLMNLCEMQVLQIDYHQGCCLFSLADD